MFTSMHERAASVYKLRWPPGPDIRTTIIAAGAVRCHGPGFCGPGRIRLPVSRSNPSSAGLALATRPPSSTHEDPLHSWPPAQVFSSGRLRRHSPGPRADCRCRTRVAGPGRAVPARASPIATLDAGPAAHGADADDASGGALVPAAGSGVPRTCKAGGGLGTLSVGPYRGATLGRGRATASWWRWAGRLDPPDVP